MPDSRSSVQIPTKKLKLAIMSDNNNHTTDSTEDEFKIVQEYLLACPGVASNSPAIKAALEGIEKEQKRQIRDAKLRSKFGATNNNISKSSSEGDELVVIEKGDIDGSSAHHTTNCATTNGPLAASTSHDDDMEWQDVSKQKENEEDHMASSGSILGDSLIMEHDGSSNSFLGKTLSKACFETFAEQHAHNKPVVVASPLAAIAVALHAALRSDTLGFACTGIPEDISKKKTGGGGIGFAPPVRELPKTEFLPKGWDNGSTSEGWSPLPLRYRKQDTGAAVLKVSSSNSSEEGTPNGIECHVTFLPANSKADSTAAGLKFPLSEHINLDSWNAAMLKAGGSSSKLAPSLHYKNLAGLLSKFCRSFDLGAVKTHDADTMETESSQARSNSDKNSCNIEAPMIFAETNPLRSSKPTTTTQPQTNGYPIPSTIDQAFPSAPAAAAARRNPRPSPLGMEYPVPHGDFAGDLLPASLQDPRFGRVGGYVGGSGNLMGPGHPMFSQGGGSHYPPGGFASGGSGTMQPRYDPIVPPGIGGNGELPDPSGGRRLGSGIKNNNRRGRVPGEPNPDHLPPPNAFGDSNMFM